MGNELANAPNMDAAQKGKINEQHKMQLNCLY
jgi:hypothetical protein